MKGNPKEDEQTINLAEYMKESEEQQTKNLTPLLKSKFLIHVGQQNRKHENELNEISKSVSEISKVIKNMRSLISSIQERKDAEKLQEVESNFSKMQKEVEETTEQFKPLTMYSTFREDSKLLTRDSTNANIYISMNPNSSGIFHYLVNSQETNFDHYVIPSQSSGDVYCIIDPSSKQNFSSGSGEYEWVQFEFPEEIEFVSFKIQSAHKAFLKTWDIIAYDSNGKEITLFKTKNNPALNGKYNEFSREFKEPVKTKKIRLEKMGANWSNTNFMRIYKIEFYSSDPKFEGKGVFEKIVNEAPNHDPHKAKVYLTASNFDFRFFHFLNPKRSICTLFDEGFPWFQVELPYGTVYLTGYRMIQIPRFPIYTWNFECSNDGVQWDIIHQGKLNKDIESNIIFVNCFPKKAYRFFRIVNTKSNDNDGDNAKLRIRHFDIFGFYQPFQNQNNQQDMLMDLNINSNVCKDNNFIMHPNIINSSSDENITRFNDDGTPIINNNDDFIDLNSPRYYDFRKVEEVNEGYDAYYEEEDEEEEEEEEDDDEEDEEEDEKEVNI